jgi:hypothetical protein
LSKREREEKRWAESDGKKKKSGRSGKVKLRAAKGGKLFAREQIYELPFLVAFFWVDCFFCGLMLFV